MLGVPHHRSLRKNVGDTVESTIHKTSALEPEPPSGCIEGQVMSGQLFTQYFLSDGIKETAEWAETAGDFEAFRLNLAWYWESFKIHQEPNESATEQDFIRPMLDALGWLDYLPQQSSPGSEDIPDHLLFSDSEHKARAAATNNPQDGYVNATVIEESKRFGLSLDSRDQRDKVQSSTPHGQILRYLSTADSITDGRIRWGILTNGGMWRLYDYRARPRTTGYFEVDLAAALESGTDDDLRLFHLLFRRESFVPQQGATVTYLETALAEGRRYEERVAQDLSGMVFDEVFPSLVRALSGVTNRELPEVREAALTFLYRLLFLLSAEDRGLLPVNDPRYDHYGLRKRVRDDVAERTERGDPFSGTASAYYNHLTTLFQLVDKGDASIGLPPYNGGLFAKETAPLLDEVHLPDTVVAQVVYALSHVNSPEGRRFVNYRDMSVQQLGSIYERLLEQEPARNPDGEIVIRPNSYARKDSGSFFTPQDLVDLIVDRTLKPLAEERLKAFEDRARELGSDSRPKEMRRAELATLDPAEAVLDLKVLDPAMGSGHFLVTAVDFLADYIAELVEYVPAVPEWLDGEYRSPLMDRVESIRQDILGRAKESDWVVDESMLTDQAVIRRMVLKRCIFGVDKNPLTVELAKVSLWLHSFTVGAPLSFLDHHLRCGDSLVGMRIAEAGPELNRLGGLFAAEAIAGAEEASAGMERIEGMSDADIAEVRESAELFLEVGNATSNLNSVFNILTGLRWLTAGMKARERRAAEYPVSEALSRHPQDAFDLLCRKALPAQDPAEDEPVPPSPALTELVSAAEDAAGSGGFLHWEAAFPGVWEQWQNEEPLGGFDAVIGNPPWDRIKLQEVEWFANRSPEVALAPTAAVRRGRIRQLQEQGDALADEFNLAKERADRMGSMIRSSGHYPLLGGGDVNLYSLFVERAMELVKPDGMIGLLTPSGIYADRTASAFFRTISTSGRIAGLFDFENRKIFFPDVHASFKFCALIFGGANRRFDGTKCAFFLHDPGAINDPERCFQMSPADFALVNPNTSTAPVFRTRRDAELARRIYEGHPVMVDRSQDGEHYAWPVRYRTMFHMTNDSHLFRTAEHLAAEGFYPVQGNRWRRGNEWYLPLYQGRMINQFDHRANSVGINPGNTHNPYLSEEVTAQQHADPEFLPQPQYWVPEPHVDPVMATEQGFAVAFRDIGRPTDVRTAIASIVPRAGYGNTVPLLMQQDDASPSAELAAMMVATLNSLCVDFVARQKVQGTHLNLYILEQLPVLPGEAYDQRFGNVTARELVRDHVLRLTYTANDMIPFARGLGFDGPTFIWDEEERRHLRARLDALYFHLYGLSRDDADYILSTFPIVQREDEAQFGTYRTRDLVLAYMNALPAGDTESVIAL